MRHQGRITTWKDDKGFGFITPDGGGEPVFVHIGSFSSRQRRPAGNEMVTYLLRVDEKGRARARSASFVGQPHSATIPPERTGRSKLPYLFAATFLLAVAAAVVLGRLPSSVLWLYLATSVLAFIAYALDKSAAKQNRWRTPESTLHLLALVGGWPGALAARRLLHHKFAKTSFQFMFWLTVVLNGGALIWLLGPAAAPVLRTLVDVM